MKMCVKWHVLTPQVLQCAEYGEHTVGKLS